MRWSESILAIPTLVRLGYGGVRAPIVAMDDEDHDNDDLSSYGMDDHGEDELPVDAIEPRSLRQQQQQQPLTGDGGGGKGQRPRRTSSRVAFQQPEHEEEEDHEDDMARAEAAAVAFGQKIHDTNDPVVVKKSGRQQQSQPRDGGRGGGKGKRPRRGSSRVAFQQAEHEEDHEDDMARMEAEAVVFGQTINYTNDPVAENDVVGDDVNDGDNDDNPMRPQTVRTARNSLIAAAARKAADAVAAEEAEKAAAEAIPMTHRTPSPRRNGTGHIQHSRPPDPPPSDGKEGDDDNDNNDDNNLSRAVATTMTKLPTARHVEFLSREPEGTLLSSDSQYLTPLDGGAHEKVVENNDDDDDDLACQLRRQQRQEQDLLERNEQELPHQDEEKMELESTSLRIITRHNNNNKSARAKNPPRPGNTIEGDEEIGGGNEASDALHLARLTPAADPLTPPTLPLTAKVTANQVVEEASARQSQSLQSQAKRRRPPEKAPRQRPPSQSTPKTAPTVGNMADLEFEPTGSPAAVAFMRNATAAASPRKQQVATDERRSVAGVAVAASPRRSLVAIEQDQDRADQEQGSDSTAITNNTKRLSRNQLNKEDPRCDNGMNQKPAARRTGMDKRNDDTMGRANVGTEELCLNDSNDLDVSEPETTQQALVSSPDQQRSQLKQHVEKRPRQSPTTNVVTHDSNNNAKQPRRTEDGTKLWTPNSQIATETRFPIPEGLGCINGTNEEPPSTIEQARQTQVAALAVAGPGRIRSRRNYAANENSFPAGLPSSLEESQQTSLVATTAPSRTIEAPSLSSLNAHRPKQAPHVSATEMDSHVNTDSIESPNSYIEVNEQKQSARTTRTSDLGSTSSSSSSSSSRYRSTTDVNGTGSVVASRPPPRRRPQVLVIDDSSDHNDAISRPETHQQQEQHLSATAVSAGAAAATTTTSSSTRATGPIQGATEASSVTASSVAVPRQPWRISQQTRRTPTTRRLEQELWRDDDGTIDSTSTNKRRRIEWTDDESLAVYQGFLKYGHKWRMIKDNCNNRLCRRTNVQIKDRFRTMVNRGEITLDEIQEVEGEGNAY